MADESTVDTQNTSEQASAEASAAPARKTAARKTAAKKTTATKTAAAKKTTAAKKATAKKTTATKAAAADAAPTEAAATETAATEAAAPEAPVAKKAAAKRAPAKRTTKKAAAAQAEPTLVDVPVEAPAAEAAEVAAPAKKTPAKRATKKATAKPVEEAAATEPEAPEAAPKKATAAKKAAAKKAAPAKRTTKKAAAAPVEEQAVQEATAEDGTAGGALGVLFQTPEAKTPRKRAPRKTSEARTTAADAGAEASGTDEPRATRTTRSRRGAKAAAPVEPVEELLEEETEALDVVAETAVEADAAGDEASAEAETSVDETDEDEDAGQPARRRRRRGGRRRRKSGESSAESDGDSSEDESSDDSEDQGDSEDAEDQGDSASSRRRRRRRRAGESGNTAEDDPENTVTKVRESRPLEQQITAVSGSTRLEAKKQRRREGREAGRRRAPIVSEAEFLARRESVERVMVIRQREDLTQIGVLEDKVLVEHYVARESQTSLIGNIYLGRVQNVLPSMEAAFIDIGKGRNAVLYAGEVNWAALGHKDGQARKIESVLSSGQTVLVQVTKDPIGHKGARLTSQISLAGRFLVYVPDGTTSGISRKLPDTERNRLKTLLKEIVPESAGVIVRTAAEGASEEELTRDVERLKARWDGIEAKAKGSAPQLLYGEPDLTLKVVRDLFTEDFAKLVIQGNDAWDTVKGYVDNVAPDLAERLERFVPGENGKDAFSTYRIDEQIAKGLDRKVWLPSGGSLIIDRTEAMTVVDVNTGKFTGSGGNLEETVTKNNLEAAEEIVRQLRLRDIGGIIVVDFIDMVLESNRDLVLRRLVECLGRDRTRHQVAEVTSLGLVQMTRKRIGTGLLEAFSENCTHCHGRGLVVHDHPVEEGKSSGVAPDEPRRSRRRGGRGKSNGNADEQQRETESHDAADPHRAPTPAEFAAMARHHDEEALESVADAEAAETPEVQASDVVESAEPAEAVVVEEFDDTSVDRAEAAVEQAEPVVEAVAETVVEPEPPVVKVVTRTRGRRGASRPAGGSSEAAPVAPVVIAPEPVAVPAPEVAAPEPPKVITRTRRGASRAVTTPEPTAVAETPEEHPVEHVPVKKRGARKR
jgi:ribonuclease E